MDLPDLTHLRIMTLMQDLEHRHNKTSLQANMGRTIMMTMSANGGHQMGVVVVVMVVEGAGIVGGDGDEGAEGEGQKIIDNRINESLAVFSQLESEQKLIYPIKYPNWDKGELMITFTPFPPFFFPLPFLFDVDANLATNVISRMRLFLDDDDG